MSHSTARPARSKRDSLRCETFTTSGLADAKTQLRIPDVWRLCALPGEPRKSCRCPFHDDRSASFSVSPDGLLWNCFAGCGGGDVVDFFQRASGIRRIHAVNNMACVRGASTARDRHSRPASRAARRRA